MKLGHTVIPKTNASRERYSTQIAAQKQDKGSDLWIFMGRAGGNYFGPGYLFIHAPRPLCVVLFLYTAMIAYKNKTNKTKLYSGTALPGLFLILKPGLDYLLHPNPHKNQMVSP